MKKKIEVSWLLDFYGKLLTEKQLNVMTMYFNEDATLSEIGTILGVSRQAIHDIINRSEMLLYEYEEKLGLLKQFKFMEDNLRDINKKLRSCKTIDDINVVCNEIDELIDSWEE